MKDRLSLQSELEEILGSKNVYYQPPESTVVKTRGYPAIIYSFSRYRKDNADNGTYLLHRSYDIILIHPDPDNTIKDEIACLPMCRFDRHYKADNLNHYAYTIYY